MQATELARERDNLNGQIVNLRTELAEAKAEVVNVRRSVVEEKQSLETRLDEERRAKERARAQLDSRMEELQRRAGAFIAAATGTQAALVTCGAGAGLALAAAACIVGYDVSAINDLPGAAVRGATGRTSARDRP